jgi:hypothetical protein
MNEEWKNNLGKQFAQRGIYRLKYINDSLQSNLKEYCRYLNEFFDLNASSGTVNNSDTYNSNSPYKVFEEMVDASRTHSIFLIVVNFKIEYDAALYYGPFKLGILFTGHDGLNIKYTKQYSTVRSLRNALDINDRQKKREPYEWAEEKFTNPEILEKEYLFQLINNRLINYMDETVKVNRSRQHGSI